ncbi:MAG: CBS domain-containing protein [Pirellulaceae bacterium]|nr:CBS domain-containing protein [Pirellulaceae bacterium]
MRVKEILEFKGDTVHTIQPQATLADVVRKLVDYNCGSLVVCDGERMVGIITERDILRACADLQAPLGEVSVAARMSQQLVTGAPDDEVEDVMGLLTERRIRHLPVVDEDGRLAGLISIGDVVKAHHQRLSVENHYLKSYIQS